MAHVYAMGSRPTPAPRASGARCSRRSRAGPATAERAARPRRHRDNEGARRFYEACGFADTGERHPLREGSSSRTLIFAKVLSAA